MSAQIRNNFQKIKGKWYIAAGLILLVISACQSTTRTVLVVPDTVGAEFVGTEDCTLCHEGIGNIFSESVHARLMIEEETGIEVGCEACHGPGSLHSMEGEGRHLIHNPGRDAAACLQCHIDMQGQFRLPHAHPVANGKLACMDCHDPHGDATGVEFGSGVSSFTETGSCAECHPAQAGPFVFEHEAIREEGCTACHDVHGSVNDKMLKVRNAGLCLQCHFTERRSNALMIGGVDHTGFGFIQQGTCWTAGCHEAVHGSHVNGSLRF